MKISRQFLLIFLLYISTLVSISSTNLSKSYALSYLEYPSYIVTTKYLNVRSSPHIKKNNFVKKLYQNDKIQGIEIEIKGADGHKHKWIQLNSGNFIYAENVKLYVDAHSNIENLQNSNPNAEGTGVGIFLIISTISILGFSLYRYDKRSKEAFKVEKERLSKIEEERIANQMIYIVIPVCYVEDHSWLFIKKYSVKIGYFYESFKGGILQEIESIRYTRIFETSEIDEQKLIELAKTTVKVCMGEITKEISQSFAGALSSAINPMLMSSSEPSIKTVDVQYQKIS